MAGGNKSNKNRKYGRNIKWCKAYKLEGRREKNNKRKQYRHQIRMIKKAEHRSKWQKRRNARSAA